MMSEDSGLAEQRDDALLSATHETPKPKLNLRKLEKIQRLLQYAAAAALLVILVLFVFASLKLSDIYAKIDSANLALQKQREEMENNNAIISSQKRTIDSQSTTISALVNPTQQLNPEQAKEVQQTVEQTIARTSGEKRIAARIYIQIGDEDQRQRAIEAVNILQGKGYIVPGIENVGGKAKIPRVSEIRYYQSDEVAQQDVKDIVATLDSIGVNIRVPDKPLESSSVRPRHYELWFGKDFPPSRTVKPVNPESIKPMPYEPPNLKKPVGNPPIR